MGFLVFYSYLTIRLYLIFRKVEGEGKDTGHGVGGGVSTGGAVPLRRWEDWERSRLRKIKREERRRREMEKAHPTGYYTGGGDLLSARGADQRSQYDGSDTFSVNSSEDDHWGPQIGGYNEHNAQYPPPPVGLHITNEKLQSAETLGTADLEAMLESGFDDRPSPEPKYQNPPVGGSLAPRYQLSDTPTKRTVNGYTPLELGGTPDVISPLTPNFGLIPQAQNGISSAVGGNGDHKTHMKKRSGGRSRPSRDDYGPLGPLDPGGKP